jgi:hypothetical protein
MTRAQIWREAMWLIHDMQMYRVPRLDVFNALVRLGLSRRDAAELIQYAEREP